MSTDLKRQAIRTIEALAQYGGVADGDAAVDVHDAIAALLDACWSRDPRPEEIVLWSQSAEQLVHTDATVGTHGAVRAAMHVLRLRRAALALVVPAEPVRRPAEPARPVKDERAVPARTRATQRKLVAYIGAHAPCRMRDAVAGLRGTMSERTVKRTLKGLLDAGVLRRSKNADGADAYVLLDARE